MKLNPYLTFKGNRAEAFRFYESRLGGRIVAMVTHADTPACEHTPPDWRDKIIHARLVVGDAVLMGSDAAPDWYEESKGISVTLNIEDPAEAERVFEALSEGATVRMPIEETFWAIRFGMLTDRYGVPWMINCEKPMASQAA